MAAVEVAVALPVERTYAYAVPAALGDAPPAGTRVLVPFGPRRVTGFVVGPARDLGTRPLRELIDVLDERPVVDEGLLRLLLWVAEYYEAPPGEAIRAALPAGLQVGDARRVRLTAMGAAAQQLAGSLPPAEARLLGQLAAATAGSVDARLLRRVLGAAAARLLARLSARGLVELDVTLSSDRVRVRTAAVVAPGRPPTSEEQAALARAPRRAALLERVRAGGEVALALLRAEDPGAAARVRALAQAGLLVVGRREVRRDPFAGEGPAGDDEEQGGGGAPPTATTEQAGAIAALTAAISAGGYAAFLLHGVTGSGKTEVYLRAIAHGLARGRGALVLVPEIALTPQLAARFRARFGDQVAVLHSGLSPGERFDEWRRLAGGAARIALGARSAVFAPVGALGVVVVDEEHDPSFKQHEGVRYHARDVALVRASREGAVILLGSATPSLESYAGARAGRLRLLELRARVASRPMPRVELIDLRVHRVPRGGLLSAPMAQALDETLAAGEQAILFLNRRGYAPTVLCRGCGRTASCAHCSVTLTFHRARGLLLCHTCGFSMARPARCPACGGDQLADLGLGTERVEQGLAERFPTARIGRLDRDTAGTARDVARLLADFRARRLDVLVGTQMVTKGHDFPAVTLVGVLLADVGLALPEFRAAERTFQLLAQVAGRAGRGDRPGRVLVQTYAPGHPAIACAGTHDYGAFAEQELSARAELGYPPSGRLVLLRIDGPDAGAVSRAAAVVAAAARRAVPAGGQVEVLGPSEAPIARVRGRTRWQLLLRGPQRPPLRAALRAARAALPAGDLRLAVDVDPASTL